MKGLAKCCYRLSLDRREAKRGWMRRERQKRGQAVGTRCERREAGRGGSRKKKKRFAGRGIVR